MTYQALHKNEFARIAGVTPRTFRTWINNPNVLEKLKETGYFKRQKILTPRQVQILCTHLVVVSE